MRKVNCWIGIIAMVLILNILSCAETIEKTIETARNIYYIQSLNLSYEDGKKWEGEGFKIRPVGDIDSAHKHAESWIKAGFSDPQIARKWKDKGFTHIEAKKWLDAGITNPKEASGWRRNQFDLEKALEWRSVGFKLLSNAIYWESKTGFSALEAFLWFKTGMGKEYAQKWNIAGFTPDEAKQWHKYKYDTWGWKFSPDEAKQWKNQGFKPEKANGWWDAIKNMGERFQRLSQKPSISKIKQWEAMGITSDDVKQWEKSIYQSLFKYGGYSGKSKINPEPYRYIFNTVPLVIFARKKKDLTDFILHAFRNYKRGKKDITSCFEFFLQNKILLLPKDQNVYFLGSDEYITPWNKSTITKIEIKETKEIIWTVPGAIQ